LYFHLKVIDFFVSQKKMESKAAQFKRARLASLEEADEAAQFERARIASLEEADEAAQYKRAMRASVSQT